MMRKTEIEWSPEKIRELLGDSIADGLNTNEAFEHQRRMAVLISSTIIYAAKGMDEADAVSRAVKMMLLVDEQFEELDNQNGGETEEE